MPQLVIDAEAMALAVSKLGGQPIFAGPGGGFLEPGVVELTGDGDEGNAKWQPSDDRTRYLALASEACRDLVHHSGSVLAAAAWDRGRSLRALTVPACSLMDVTSQLVSTLNESEQRAMRAEWPAHDQETYLKAGRRLKKHLGGSVRTARNKVGAHLDSGAYESPVKLTLDDLLAGIGDCLLLLLLALNHKSHSFAWIRPLGSTLDGERRVVETMFSYPVALRWLTDSNGRVLDVGFLQLAADPRIEIQDIVLSAATTYNQLAQLEGSSAPQIWATSREVDEQPPDAFRLAATTR
jgi:hypothetical protein